MLVAIDLQTACTLQASHHPCLPWSCGSACISSTPPPRVAFFWLQTAYWIKTSGFSASTSKPSIRAACCTGRSSSNFTQNEMWGKRQSWNLLDSHGHSKLQPPSCIPTSCTTNYCIQIDISWFWYFMYDIQFENIQCIFMKWKKYQWPLVSCAGTWFCFWLWFPGPSWWSSLAKRPAREWQVRMPGV